MATERQHATVLEVESWPVERLIPYARNPRVITEKDVAKVAASIAAYAFLVPILVTADGVIIAGHTRRLALMKLGLKEAPVIICSHLNDAQAMALRLMDNRSAQGPKWDPDLLAGDMEELAAFDFDLSLTGFDDDEIAALLAPSPTVGLIDSDEAPEPPDSPVSRSGDLWLLGGHRLLCGDSTRAEDVQRLMDGKRAVLMATDPPYLVDYDGGNHPQTWANGGKEPGAPKDAGTKHWDAYTDHESAVTFYRDFIATALQHALNERPLVYQWFGMMKVDIVLEAWRAAGLLPHQILIWKKSRHVLTRCDFMWDYEPFMYGWVQGDRPTSVARPPANATAVWEIDSKIEDEPGSIHPTMKPVELIRRPIEYHTAPGGLIYEPFSGSGTAIIAAESTGRRCNAIELSPAFVDVALLRWQAFTGEQARLDDDGRSFDEVAAERVP